MQRRSVVVSGLGAVSAFGWGVEALEPVFKGQSAIQPYCVSEWPGASEVLAARVAQPLPEGLFDRRVHDADRVTQMAVFAAHEALGNAQIDPQRVGLVCWGTGYGGAATMDDAYTRLLFGRTDLSARLSPLTVPKAMTHASAAGIAAFFKLTCPVMTYSSACASSAAAIAEAIWAIECGRCDVALVGGSEALIVPGVVKAWECLQALAPCQKGQVWHGPFSELRQGLVLGEGAACLVLESAAHAHQRGVDVLARCLGCAMVNDPECVTHPSAAPQVQAMEAALERAGLSPDQVSYVNAHATGTRAGDQSEIEAINVLFRHTKAQVSSTKAATGHLMGASGAIEALVCIEALRKGRYPPNVSLGTPDAAIGFSLVNKSLVKPGGVGLSNSFAFGGSNVSLVFSV